MKIFPVLGISLIQLCKSSLSDRNGEKSSLIDTTGSITTAPSLDGCGNISGPTSITEIESLFPETPMTYGSSFSFEADEDHEFDNLISFLTDDEDERGLYQMIEEDVEAPIIEQGESKKDHESGSLQSFITNDEDERDLYQMIEEDLESPIIEQDQQGTNENIQLTLPRYIEEDSFLKKLITSLFKPMILPSIPQEHPLDPSRVSMFSFPPSSHPEVNESPEFESPVVSSFGNDNNYYNGCEDRSVTRYKDKMNQSASTSTGKPRWGSNKADSETSRQNDEKKIDVARKRRLELLTHKGDENDASRSESDETESEPMKRSKTATDPELANDDEEQYISFGTLEIKKMRFEEDIRRCASYEEWIEEQRSEARKKNDTVDEIDILLKVLEGLGLVKGENPNNWAINRALSRSLSTKETEITGRKKSKNDANASSFSQHSICLVKSMFKQGCKQKKILRSDLQRVASEKMRIYFNTNVFFAIFEPRIPSTNNNILDYQILRKGLEDKVLPVDSLASKKYAYLRNALVEAGIKVIEAKVGSAHTLYLGNTDGNDTLKVSNFIKRREFFQEAAEDLIKFTGVRRVFYTIHSRDLSRHHEEYNQWCLSKDERKSRPRREHHKEVAQWLERLKEGPDGALVGSRVEYLLVVQRIPSDNYQMTDEKCRSLLVMHQIIDKNSSLSVLFADNLMKCIMGVH